MDTTTALFLGFLQGLTEFLPVSSSGHLVLAESWLDISHSTPILFDLILHLATLMAVGVYFRARITALFSTLLHWRSSTESSSEKSMIIAIFISTFITCVTGLILKKLDIIDAMRTSPYTVGWALIFTGIILFLTYFKQGEDTENDSFPIRLIWFGIILGLAQSIAVLPGVSRSGMTISTALLLGSSKKMSLEYSFIMSIPVILLANIYEMKDGIGSLSLTPIIVGFMASLICGYIFLNFLSWLTRSGKLYQFAFYTIPVGIWVIFTY